jgi:hypothetical protein
VLVLLLVSMSSGMSIMNHVDECVPLIVEEDKVYVWRSQAERTPDVFVKQPVKQRRITEVKHKLAAGQPLAALADRAVCA